MRGPPRGRAAAHDARGGLTHVRGGEGRRAAIEAAHRLLAEDAPRAIPAVPELTLEQIGQQLGLAVDRVMTEGSLYDRELAALAIKQARGDLVEAIFLLRAYRTTLPRFGASRPVDTARMTVRRRISATFKDLPGGQILGPTFDYTHRLLDFDLGAAAARRGPSGAAARAAADAGRGADVPRVVDLLDREGLIESRAAGRRGRRVVADLTREPLTFPAERDVRLQNLARGDEGFLAGPGLRDPAGLRPQPSVRGRDPAGRGRRGARARGAGVPGRRSPRSR